MLYNVLPPLAFFVSLGGIILVVSRVVVRLRRQDWEESVKKDSSKIALATKKVTDLAAVVGPNQKSVHTFKNRLAYLAHSSRQTARSLAHFIHHAPTRTSQYLAQRKKRRKEQEITAHQTRDKTTGSIQPPRSAMRERLASLSQSKQQVLKTWKQKRQSAKKEWGEKRSKISAINFKKKTVSDNPPQRLKDKQKMIKPEQDAPAQPKTGVNIGKLFHKEPKPQITPLAKARAACQERNFNKAEDILIPYLMKNPRDTKAYMLLGSIASGRKSWDEAVEIYDQVVQLDPATPGAWAALGRAAHEGGKITRAIQALQRAHDADPTDIDTIQRLLTIARRMDNTAMQHSLIEQLKELS